MKKVTTAFALMAGVGLLAGCEDGTLDEDSFASYDDLSAEYERIAEEHAGTAFVAPADLPGTGGAVYEGVISIIVEDGPVTAPVQRLNAVGGLELEVDFGNNSGGMVGGASNFYLVNGDPVEGGGRFDLAFINDAAVPGVDPTFSLNLLDGFRLGASRLSGTLSGNFRDQAAAGAIPDGASGSVGGTVTAGPGETFRGTWVTQFDPTEDLNAVE